MSDNKTKEEELDKLLKELGFNDDNDLADIIYQYDSFNDYLNSRGARRYGDNTNIFNLIGPYNKIDQSYPTDNMVVYFQNWECYLKFYGVYDSYDGMMWSDGYTFVKPIKKEIIDYE
jgi:hypothetical protein